MLVDEYDQHQKLINDTLQRFAATDFAEFDDLDAMMMHYNQFKQFTSTLRESDSRRSICETIRQSYDQMLSRNLRVETISSDRESTRVALFYGQKQLICTLVPKVKSNCLTAIEIKNAISSSVIRYDFSTGCYEDEQNWLDIVYTILGKKYNTRCYIK
jgi:hypothetical protein